MELFIRSNGTTQLFFNNQIIKYHRHKNIFMITICVYIFHGQNPQNNDNTWILRHNITKKYNLLYHLNTKRGSNSRKEIRIYTDTNKGLFFLYNTYRCVSNKTYSNPTNLGSYLPVIMISIRL